MNTLHKKRILLVTLSLIGTLSIAGVVAFTQSKESDAVAMAVASPLTTATPSTSLPTAEPTSSATARATALATPAATTSPLQTATPPSTPTPTPATKAGAYTSYTASSISQTSGTKILFFHAPWCPQCRSLEASIQAGTIPNNTTIFKVDYDSNQALRRTYGVTLQTTLVLVDDSGNLVKKFVAYEDPSLDALVKNLLQ